MTNKPQVLVSSPVPYAVLYPKLVKAARAKGYALAIHGSMVRDFDLIAVPWVEDAAEPLELVFALKEVCTGVFISSRTDYLLSPDFDAREKPHGRLSWVLHLTEDGMYGPYLDIAVMPRIPKP